MGEPLKLRYDKGLYGPYAANLRHVLYAIDGHLISGYGAGADSPSEQIALVPGAVEEAEQFLQSHHATRVRFEHVTDLVDGFETPFGLELLATAHWVAAEEGASSENEVRARFYSWSVRKQQFTHGQVGLALERLKVGGWV